MSEIAMQKTETIPTDVIELAAELGLGDQLYAILDITREMYPGDVSLETGYDPEWPEDRWICFVVQSSSSFKEIIEQELEWGRRIAPLTAPRLDAVTIFVVPRGQPADV